MKELVAYIAKSLATKPADVDVSEKHGKTATILELRLAMEDFGHLIGREGRTVNAIRTLITAATSRTNEKVFLRIVDDK